MDEKITLQWTVLKVYITKNQPRLQGKIAKITQRHPIHHQEKVVVNQIADFYQITLDLKY